MTGPLPNDMLQKASEDPKKSKNVLVLVRHGQSEWNRLNMFTGWKDVGLSEEGVSEAHRAGSLLNMQPAPKRSNSLLAHASDSNH